MQILWWLAPPVVATVLAMAWAAWLGRDGRGRVDREVAVRRMGEALSRPARPARPARPTKAARSAPARAARQGERSTGVAVRPSSRRTSSDPSSDPSSESSSRPSNRPGTRPGSAFERTRRAS